jgi:hypothetical protein
LVPPGPFGWSRDPEVIEAFTKHFLADLLVRKLGKGDVRVTTRQQSQLVQFVGGVRDLAIVETHESLAIALGVAGHAQDLAHVAASLHYRFFRVVTT